MSDGTRPKFTFEVGVELRTGAEAAAKEAGLTLSAWVREAMTEKIERLILELEEGATVPEPPASVESGSLPVSAPAVQEPERSSLVDGEALDEDDMPPEPEEMLGHVPVADSNAALAFRVDDREGAVERVRMMHGAPALCTKGFDCQAPIHFPGCPHSSLKAIR